MNIEYPIYFIRADGYVFVAENRAVAELYGVGATKHRQVIRSREVDGTISWERTIENDWIARDALGRTIHPDEIRKPLRKSGWWVRHQEKAQNAANKGLPIPGTGRHGRHKSARYRHEGRYICERRNNAAIAGDLAECGLAVKHVARLRKVGPVPYEDDSWRKSERNWKSQRKTRWIERA